MQGFALFQHQIINHCLVPVTMQAIDRRERLRRLALETIDLAKDPYYMRNHLGQIECKLCLTLHPNEGNYLAHTQVGLVEDGAGHGVY
jgi:hypothetical protein